MWPFKKKKREEGKSDEDDSEEEDKSQIPQDAGLGTKIEMIQAELTKINGVLESFKEVRKSTTERFATINEQMGEIRGQLMDINRSMGILEVKATKAADLVESVHPDKLMIQVQKEDGKIEGLRGLLEAKDEMIKNVMDQLKKLRDQINVFRGVEQVIKLNEEVKDELMGIKRVSVTVERHADRVENIFIEAQKSFEAFNTFSDKLESQRGEFKEMTTKVDKLEVSVGAAIKKKDFEAKIEAIEKHDKRVKKVLEEAEEYFKKIDEKFNDTKGKLKGEFEFKLEKAEILSKAFDDMLKKNPMFASGLNLGDYLKKNIESEEGDSGPKPKKEGAEAKAEPPKELVEGMTPVKS